MAEQEEKLHFVWEEFTTEKPGAVQQVIEFTEQFCFLEPLFDFIEPEEAFFVFCIDSEIRMESFNLPPSKEMEEVTIYIT